MRAHMRTTDAHLQQPTQNRTSHLKASTASPNLATFSRASTCLTSLPLPSPIRGESPFEASHSVASPGRINFQLTTGGWPGVSAWPEPRQTGCGTRADDHTQGRGGRGWGKTRLMTIFTVAGSLNHPGEVPGGLGQPSKSSCPNRAFLLPASWFQLPASCILSVRWGCLYYAPSAMAFIPEYTPTSMMPHSLCHPSFLPDLQNSPGPRGWVRPP